MLIKNMFLGRICSYTKIFISIVKKNYSVNILLYSNIYHVPIDYFMKKL